MVADRTFPSSHAWARAFTGHDTRLRLPHAAAWASPNAASTASSPTWQWVNEPLSASASVVSASYTQVIFTALPHGSCRPRKAWTSLP